MIRGAALAVLLGVGCGSKDPLADLALEPRTEIVAATGFTIDVPRGATQVDHPGEVVGWESAQRHPRVKDTPLVDVRVAVGQMPASLEAAAAKAKGEVVHQDELDGGFLVSYWEPIGNTKGGFVTIVFKAGALAVLECRSLTWHERKPSSETMRHLESICASLTVH